MENCKTEELFAILNNAKNICETYPKNSFEMCKDVYDISMGKDLKLIEGYALVGMALACRAESETSRMLNYSYNALDVFEVLKEPYGQAKSLNLIGIAYFYSSMYEESLKYFLQAEDLLSKFKDDFLLSSILNNIGEIYRESEIYDKALEYFNKALDISKEVRSKINVASLLGNIGEVYFSENKYDESFEFFTQSYKILKEGNEMISLGEVENKLGKIYFAEKNYNKAEEYYFSALKRLENISNKFYAIDVMINISRLYIEKDSDKAFYYLEKAIGYAKKTNAKKKLCEVFKSLSDFYERTDNYRDALEFFKKYHRVEQEIAASVVENKFEIMKIEFDHLKENHEFEKIKMLNRRLELEISNERKELEKIQEINKVLEKKALDDELTGVPNRSYVNYCLNKVWEKSFLYDQNQVIALFMLDIDNFKKYNDYWGHLKGDECLKEISSCIKNIQEKRGDIFGRYGGEEFVYLAKDISYNQALKLGDLIRTEVKNLCIKTTADDDSSVVTISAGGVYGKPSGFKNIMDMLQVADEKLYNAKGIGKNVTIMKRLI